MPIQISDDKAAIVETEVKRWWDYVDEAYREARREWNNTLQWVFAVIAGGSGLAASLYEKGFWEISLGLVTSAGWCSWIAYDLLRNGKSQTLMPPGFEVKSITQEYLDESTAKFRYLLSMGLDDRARFNNSVATKLSESVDKAREHFSWVPMITAGIAVVAWMLAKLYQWIVALMFLNPAP